VGLKGNNMKTRKDFRVGDKVFCFGFGQGIVKKVSECYHIFDIFVEFEGCDGNINVCYFTLDGKRYGDEKRCLFHGELPIIPPEWIEVEDKPNINDLKIDDKIMVKCNRDTCWIKRFFAGISEDNERVMCFLNGANSWTSNITSEWDEWRLPTEEELK
jgi:hypothetical protein